MWRLDADLILTLSLETREALEMPDRKGCGSGTLTLGNLGRFPPLTKTKGCGLFFFDESV